MANELFTRDIYNNPTELPVAVLDAVSSRLLNGGEISDSNSPFVFSLEMFCTIAAGIIESNSNQFPAIYTRRAQTLEDLYKNLSDYEHVEMHATPAMTEVSLILEKNQLLERAKLLNSEYFLIQIPKDVSIEVGDYKFGVYYPINIMITKSTKLVYITYDGTLPNPLHVLSDNNVTFREYKYSLADIIDIKLPIYQFETTKEQIDCSKVSGLNKRLTFNNKFYAIRVYNYKDSTWNELKIVYSETMYDPDEPSVVVKVYSDTNVCELYIPQVYFDNDLIGSKIRVEMFTTLGAIDIDISNIDFSRIKFVVPNQNDNPNKTYAEALNKLETCHIVPLKPLINGGTNEADFKTIKRRIQNRISSSGLLVAPGQLEAYYEDLGFSIKNVKDTLEERIYAACGLLTDSQGIPIQVAMDTTEVPLVVDTHMTKHVVMGDNAITVLPSATFRYHPELKRFAFITEQEQQALDTYYATDKSAFCLFLNSNTFSRPMYHVHLRTNNRTPYITNYDLSNPEVTKIKFMSENIKTAERVTVIGCRVTHNGYEDPTLVDHTYNLNLEITSSEGITELLKNSPENVKLLAVMTTNNIQIMQVATYDSLTGTFNITISPNYKFNLKGDLGINLLTQSANSVMGNFTNPYTTETYVPLDCTMSLLFLANLPDISNEILLPNIDEILPVKYKQLGLQELDIKLGSNLHDKLYASVDVAYRQSDIQDARYVVTEDEYLVYDEDEYLRDIDDSLKINISTVNSGESRIKRPTLKLLNNSIVPQVEISAFEVEENFEAYQIDIQKKHAKGEQVLDEFGKPTILRKVGDLRTDVNGNPIIRPREIVFMGNILQVGLNLFYSELTITEALQSITNRTFTQFTKITNSASRLLENTYVLYRPFTCIGSGTFFTDSKKVIDHSLAISLRFKCYVPEHVTNDVVIQRQIRSKIIEFTETLLLTGRLSVTEISSMIRSEFAAIIRHVDIFGINEDINLQMIEGMDKTKQPVLKQELWLDENRHFILNKAVIIQFVN